MAFVPHPSLGSKLASNHHLSRPISSLRDFQSSQNLGAPSFPNIRSQLLHEELTSVGVDADGILSAALRSLENPMSGYDENFGKPAIRTYRSFIDPNKRNDSDIGDPDSSNTQLKKEASRTARQVEFLIKRHHSHQTTWVRHHDVIRDRRQVFPLILILDNVRSAFNVGSLYRTADATGCQAVYTCGITPHPHGSGADKLSKSALGAELVVDTTHFKTTREAILFLRETQPGYSVIGMETTDQSKTYTDIFYSSHPKVALVLGNEVTGVDTTLFSELDHFVEIPMFGAKNSLNVAACAPVVLYEILRQWDA